VVGRRATGLPRNLPPHRGLVPSDRDLHLPPPIAAPLTIGDRKSAVQRPSRIPAGLPAVGKRPPWITENLLDAVRLIDIAQNRRDLEAYARNTTRATAPNEYANFNEAQRDKALMAGALDFMLRHHPLLTLQLMAAKAVRFLYRPELGWRQRIPVGIVGLLAIFGLISSLKDRRVAPLGLMALAYAGVYVVSYPFYYRYRYPIEPVLVTLAGIAVIRLVQLGGPLRARLSRAPLADTS
jgi:hypothetical protein